jgi:CRP-like cAMP-binding protein
MQVAAPRENRLLGALPARDLALLQSSLKEVDLKAKQVVETPQVPIEHVYFVTSGLISVVAVSSPGERIEVGMVGPEGMTGLALVLGADRSVTEAMVQSSGVALRLPSGVLREALRASPALSKFLRRYVQAFSAQATQAALANGRAQIPQRLARWLLMWQDRLQMRNLTVTHEFLALLLGVRRQGVTVRLHELESSGLIKASRNQVEILDREGLKRLAAGFYGVPEAEYERLLAGGINAEGDS